MTKTNFMHPRIKSTLLFLLASLCIGLISQASQTALPKNKLGTGEGKTLENTQPLNEPLAWEVMEKEIVFKFPDQVKNKNITGNIVFENTANAQWNKTCSIPAGKSLGRCISIEWLKKGEYKMLVQWQADNHQYYSEGLLSLK